MRDINRYGIRQYVVFWKSIAFELNLKFETICSIEKSSTNHEGCLCKALEVWLKESSNDITWKVLEMAIINAKRLKDGLKTVKDLDGKKV